MKTKIAKRAQSRKLSEAKSKSELASANRVKPGIAKTKRRIAMISEHASPLAALGGTDSGGQNVYVAQTSQYLADMGYQVDIFTRCDSAELPDIYRWGDGIRVIHVPAGPAESIPKEELLPYMQPFAEYMIDFIKDMDEPYQLIHANFFMSGLVAAEIKKALGIPFVITFHALGRIRREQQGENDAFPDERFAVEDRLIAEADQIIAECPQEAEQLISLYQASPDKITINPAGFDPGELRPVDKSLSRRILGLSESDNVILQLGRMVPRKGVDNVIRGFARMVKEHKIRGTLIVVGGESDEPDPEITPELGRLMEIAAEEDVSDLVLFTGRKDRRDLKHYYSAADIFVSTPWYEPFGLTPIEAMACGTPVIGANVGGIQYTVADGETGFLVEPNQPEELAEKMAYMLSKPHLLKKMSQNAIQRVNNHFTWEKVANGLASIYEKVLTPESSSPKKNGHHIESKEVGQPNSERIDRQKNSPERSIEKAFASATETLDRSRDELKASILEAAEVVGSALENDRKVLVCGNGGSAAQSSHLAAEFTGRFAVPNRRAFPVLALTTDTSFLTAWSNDFSYDQIFARQIEAFGREQDVLIGLSTSGKSANLVHAFRAARAAGLTTIALLGKGGGDLLPLADIAIVVPSNSSQRIQEVHLFALHLISELVEMRLFPDDPIFSKQKDRAGKKGQNQISRKQKKTDEFPAIMPVD